jgi:hypothetical protein
MDLKAFQEWCEAQQLHSQKERASAIGVSAQTIRNWEVRGDVPYWLRYSTHAITEGIEPLHLTVANFKAWQQRCGLPTNEATGIALGRKRQSVHQWFSRSSFPKWLALACTGYEHQHKAALKPAITDQSR